VFIISSPAEVFLKHLGWNCWWSSVGACHFAALFEQSSLPWGPSEHASAAHAECTPCDAKGRVVPAWWRPTALQPGWTSTSEQYLWGAVDRESGTCCVASAITRLNAPRFFLCWHVKSIAYAISADTREELTGQIHAAFEQIQHSPQMFNTVRQSLPWRCNECNQVQGRRFEHLL
jgi:hypothetical protein